MVKRAAAFTLTAVLLSSPAWAYVHEESVEKTIPAGGRTAVVVSNPNGLVKIRPADGGDIELEAKKIVKAKGEDSAVDVAEDVKVRVVEGSDKIEIIVEIPSRYKRGSGIADFLGLSSRSHVTVDLYIDAPPSLRAIVSTASGDVDIEGLDAGGEIDVTSGDVWLADCSGDFTVGVASGDVEIEEITGDLDLSSASGEVRVRDIRGSVDVSIASGDFLGKMIEGSFRLDGASGDVTVENCAGAVDVSTASGDVVLKSVSGELTVDTSSGDVTAEVTDAGVMDVRVSCSSGDVELSVPSGASYALDIGSVSGSIHCKVPLSVEKVTRNELRGVVGGGAGSVSLNTSSGDIKIYEG
jgi:DUF4097 and DUF4098 domain-containing protein YvlB